ncbi:Uncharacterised protein [uncultured archaeon]|nr:Uncharacterised protein [uncultured archaeon]
MVKKKDSFKQLYVSLPAALQSETEYSNLSGAFRNIFSVKDKDLLQIAFCAVISVIFLALSFSASILFFAAFFASLGFLVYRAVKWYDFQLVKRDFEENGIF